MFFSVSELAFQTLPAYLKADWDFEIEDSQSWDADSVRNQIEHAAGSMAFLMLNSLFLEKNFEGRVSTRDAKLLWASLEKLVVGSGGSGGKKKKRKTGTGSPKSGKKSRVFSGS